MLQGVCQGLSVAPAPSRVASYAVRGFDLLVKRDDQYRLTHEFGGGVSGNKARKLYELAVNGPGASTKAVASLGGHQSNAMPSIAALCRARGVPFFYVCKPVPRWLRSSPAGNFARGLALGAERGRARALHCILNRLVLKRSQMCRAKRLRPWRDLEEGW